MTFHLVMLILWIPVTWGNMYYGFKSEHWFSIINCIMAGVGIGEIVYHTYALFT